VAQVTITRHVAADPASVALLLAEPAGSGDGAVLTPPRRTGVGFAASIALVDALGAPVAGDVSIEPATDEGSELRLVLGDAEAASSRTLQRAGESFLSELAIRARSRSHAA
jgi:hypothetical protein